MAFEEAEDLAPSVLILEDLDHLTESEGVSMSYLLNLMDGLVTPEGILIVATTNHPEVLDAALLQRPSRFDKVWHFPLPAFGERLELLRRRAAGKFSEQAVDGAARHSQGFTMAYVQEAVVSALLAALHERRGPRDEDLAESVRRLREQFSSGFKADGALKEPKSVGFAAADEL
jgi:SpoVK/Ycf46/Vps4 family AAA+-type ATPase